MSDSTMRRLFCAIAAIMILLGCAPAMAQVSGPCGNCHTMHDSQNGDPVYTGEEPRLALLNTDCVGCHSATDGVTWKDAVTGAPIVYNVVEPSYGATIGDGNHQGLAGGNFYWVTQDDTFGHNIFTRDPKLDYAPGTWGCVNSCHDRLDEPMDPGASDISSRSGCRGCHMLAGSDRWHHADDSDLVMDSPEEGWYRFLASHTIVGLKGVVGIEDPDWEHSATSTTHNEYLGVPGNKLDSGFGLFGADNGQDASSFCTGCHYSFHNQSPYPDGGDWILHPSDSVLPGVGEYAGYTIYDPLVPVARPALTGVSGVVTPGTDLVMCLSCHRAHASPYEDMLRFNYAGMVAGGGGADGTGCFKCHTAKDGI